MYKSFFMKSYLWFWSNGKVRARPPASTKDSAKAASSKINPDWLILLLSQSLFHNTCISVLIVDMVTITYVYYHGRHRISQKLPP